MAVTVTLAGTVKFVLFEASGTTNPPVGAPALNVTVHALFPGVLTVVGVQLSPERDTGTGSEIDPGLPDASIGPPASVEATTPVI